MYSYEDNYLWPDELLLVGESLNNVADRFNRMIEMWQEADLLPLPDGVKVTAKQIFDGKVEVGVYDIYLERSVLPVYILVIERSQNGNCDGPGQGCGLLHVCQRRRADLGWHGRISGI